MRGPRSHSHRLGKLDVETIVEVDVLARPLGERGLAIASGLTACA